MTEIKMPKSDENIILTFLDSTKDGIEVQFELPKSIAIGLRRRFHDRTERMFHHTSSYYKHDYLMWAFFFNCDISDFTSALKEELNIFDMEILSFNNKVKYAEELLDVQPNMTYDVALSFAGEDRAIVKQIAEDLKEHSISVFYDEFEKEKLWGKNLNDYFKSTYAENTRFVIPFISEHYPNKDWTNFEFTVAHAEAKKRDSEFILPVRIDNTPVVGIPSSVAYLDYNVEDKDGIVKAILSKLEN